MTTTLDSSEILGLLDWYRAMGVDAALDIEPIDWLARGPLAPGQAFDWPSRQMTTIDKPTGDTTRSDRSPDAPPVTVARDHSRADVRPRPQTPLAPSEAETDGRRAARSATSLDALSSALAAFDGCSLKATASNLCFYRGAPTARVMLIGEAPGRDEDIEGKPFVGRAGQLLDKMLAAIGLGEGDVHITNVVYWRPPGNRTPTPQETLACRPFLERQIELVQPEFIVALGGSAAKELLGVAEGIMRLRGKWRDVKIGNLTLPAIATLHPAYLLRTPSAKHLAWQDLLHIQTRLRG